MLDLDTALEKLLAAARPVPAVEVLPLARALGRVLAEDVLATLDVPGFDNSAMDGYALNVPDFAAPPAAFTLSGRIAAGETGHALAAGEAARIFTGAPVPPGANAVTMQEDCSAGAGEVVVRARLQPGLNIRRRGEDITAGRIVLAASSRLTPQALGLAASVGVAELKVRAPLRVALLSTGNELTEPGQPLGPGKIYNSNRYALLGLLQSLGCEVSDFGIVEDDFDATVAALSAAAAGHDVVITSGGVSVGEEDHVKAALRRIGELDLWQIAIKPGKPFALGRIGDADFIGLPGNPVSAFVTFLLLARPFLLRRQGVAEVLPKPLQVRAAFAWTRPDKRRNFLRARLDAGGAVELFPNQGSGVLTSLVWAEGLVDLAPGQTVAEGEMVRYFPLSGLIGGLK